MATQESFELSVVVVSVHTRNGATHIEDWAPADAAGAKEYARETSSCADVLFTEFSNGKTGEYAKFGH